MTVGVNVKRHTRGWSGSWGMPPHRNEVDWVPISGGGEPSSVPTAKRAPAHEAPASRAAARRGGLPPPKKGGGWGPHPGGGGPEMWPRGKEGAAPRAPGGGGGGEGRHNRQPKETSHCGPRFDSFA